jgi:hypothetical protein
VPFFSSFRIPSRYTVLVPLSGALCVAFAARALLERSRIGSVARRAVEVVCLIGVCQIVLVNREQFRGVFILPPVGTESRLLEPMTPTVVERELPSGGPRVHRTYMLESMQNGLTTLNCYEPLRVPLVAGIGPAVLRADGDAAISDQTFSPNRVSAAVTAGPQPGRLVLNQNFASGWSASLGDVERDPRTGQPSVVVPAGFAGSIELRFVPPGLWLGLAVCAAGVAVSVILWRRAA